MEGVQALEALGCREDGLSEAEAAARLARFGPNVLPRAERTSVLVLYLRQFKNPLVYLLLAATVVSLGVGELADAFFIFVVLQLNAAIGAFQEWKARENAAALDALIGSTAIVLRDGRPTRVDAVGLVPGDVVQLQSGAQVSADLRLLSERELTVDESLLTGESTPVTKDSAALDAPLDGPIDGGEVPLADRRNMLLAGTILLQGRATGLVTATGGGTEIGHIAEALAKGSPVAPPLVRNLERFSRIIGIATVVLIALFAATQALQGVPLVTVFMVAVALAVAAIPEGLPVAITVALAIATNRMGARKVIVRALPAVEGLGACTHIASDKTGTLTCNELTIKSLRLYGKGAPDTPVLIGGEGFAPDGEATLAGRPLEPDELGALRRLAETGALCNEASVRFTEAGAERLGDTVDVAFLVMARKLGLDHGRLQLDHTQLGLIPYEPHRRYGASYNAAQGAAAMAHVKGAAEVVLPLCEAVDRDWVLAEADRMAAAGFRVLAVARGPVSLEQARKAEPEPPGGLELLGLVGLIDPVRPEVPAAIDLCRRAGIGVSMVTGDHPETALAIARRLKIAESPAEVVTGAALAAAGEGQAAFDRLVRRGSVFARVEPLQKLAIVQAMQRNGEVVAVTGDGVNDAAALGTANIGVAMGRGGTDVTRGAADLILADDNFASIVAGVEEGRIAYDNVRKLIFLLITTGLGEIVLFFLAIVTGHPVPLTAVQLLWLNLVTNGIQHVALAFERGEPGILDRKPRPPKQPLFDASMVAQVLAAGIFMGAMAFLFYIWCLSQGMDQATARNLLLLLMVLFENAHALNARSESRSVFQVPFSANWFLILAVLGAHALHIGAMYLPGLSELLDMQPVAFTDWAMAAAVAMSLIVVVELYKKVVAPRLRHPDASAAA